MLTITNLRKSFREKSVLKDVSFTVNAGEIVCLLGNNGAGKTTIINCILKMIRQDSGEIRLDNKSTAFSVYSALSYEFFSHLF